MAYIVGFVTEEEEAELKRRGWDLEPAPAELIEVEDEEERGRMKMVFVDASMFTIMSGPDWDVGE